jgi:two-component system cell cycle sensor histidine kinase/response regulator CckA
MRMWAFVCGGFGAVAFGVLAPRGDLLSAALVLLPTAAGMVAGLQRPPPQTRLPPPSSSSTRNPRSGFGLNRVEELATALVKLNDAVIIADSAGKVIDLNPIAEELTGWLSVEAVGKPMVEVCHLRRMNAGDLQEDLAHAAVAGRTMSSEQPMELIHRDGSTRPVAYVASPLVAAGGERRLLLLFRDVSERVAVKNALERTERDFAELIDKSPDGIVVLGGDNILYANQAFGETLGRDPESLRNESFAALSASAPSQTRSALDEDSDDDARRMRLRRQDDGLALVELSPVRTTEWRGKPATLISVRDITERSRLEDKLAVTERMAAMGTLAAGVAHEINNPLTYILANLEVIQDTLTPQLPPATTEDGELMTELIDEVLEGVSSIRQIVGDLSTFSRHGDDDETGAADLDAVLQSVINLTAGELRHVANSRVELQPLPQVQGNEGRLRQVFLNLILNAIHAVGDEHTDADANFITIRSGVDDHGQVWAEVEDTGPGIAPEVQARIFDPFFTTKPIGEGTGLGLAVCHKLITHMGGEIEVDSEVGRGTRFRVMLPVYRRGADHGMPSTFDAPPRPPGLKVLIVDDDLRVARSIARSLRPYASEVVTSGRDAFDQIKQHHFDAIVCDLMMPGLNGIQLYRTLIDEDPTLEERFVFVTGGVFTHEAREFASSMGPRCLEKPLARDQIFAHVQRIVERPPPQRAAPAL